MPAWSLSGPILLALTAQAGGDRGTPIVRSGAPLGIVDIARGASYRLPDGRAVDTRLPPPADKHSRRLDRTAGSPRLPIVDPQGDTVRTLLRDRLARRGGGLDGRIEWRLRGARSDLGLGGGLARVIDTMLRR